MNKRHLTILHANDLHGQLAFKVGKDMKIKGGISLLCGYVNKVRKECGNTFFGVCGDVLQEDINGSDYKGSNTVNLINLLNPQAVSIGNHELDYGLSHLLIFNQCLKSPILCGNIMVTPLKQELFTPSEVFVCGDVKVLAIGLIPKSFITKALNDDFCRKMLEYKDSYSVIREQLMLNEDKKPDLVVIMSHYGIEGDRELAMGMPEDLHVDLILGGHSHINMDEAEIVNGIPLAQSSYGTTHIGRFEIDLKEEGGIESFTWERVELDEDKASFSREVDELADAVVFSFNTKMKGDHICSFDREYKNPHRFFESEMGDIFADVFLDLFRTDMVILQSGCLRSPSIGPLVTEKDLHKAFPFDDRFYCAELTGRKIKEAFSYLLNPDADGLYIRTCLQYSRGFQIVIDADDYKNKGLKLVGISLNGHEFEDEKVYRIALSGNCIDNFERYFGFTVPSENTMLLTLSSFSTLSNFLISKEEIKGPSETVRIIVNNYKED